MKPDTIEPMIAIGKELDVRFALGYSAAEFTASLDRIASGAVDVAPLVTGTVGIDGVASAFSALHNPDDHAKIIVRPNGRSAS